MLEAGRTRVQENPSLEAPLQEQSLNGNPNLGIGVPPSGLLRANLDTPEVPNMSVMMGLMQSMAQTNGQLAQLIPTLAQSARQTIHHNRGMQTHQKKASTFELSNVGTSKYSMENPRTLS